jgi:CRP-like cAMP-binding protein
LFDDAAALLSQHPMFSCLTADARNAVLTRGSLLHLDAGDVLYRAGDAAVEVYAVLSGAFQIEYPKPTRHRGFVSAMLLAPTFVGECQALHGRNWSGTGITLSPVTVLAIDRSAFEELLQSHTQFAYAAYRELTSRFLGAIDAWKHQQKSSPEERLARYLLSYSEVFRRLALPLDGPALKQTALGPATALRRETVNRLLHS